MNINEICYTESFCEYQLVDTKQNVLTVMRFDRTDHNRVTFTDYRNASTSRMKLKGIRFWLSERKEREKRPLDRLEDLQPYSRRHGFCGPLFLIEPGTAFSRLAEKFH